MTCARELSKRPDIWRRRTGRTFPKPSLSVRWTFAAAAETKPCDGGVRAVQEDAWSDGYQAVEDEDERHDRVADLQLSLVG